MFNEDYYERGIELGVSGYSNYRWIPELTIPMCARIIEYLGISEDDTILDFGCFVAGTKVTLPDLTHRSIEEIKKGDVVLTPQGNIRKVTNTFKRMASNLVEIKSLYGISFVTTLEHPILVKKRSDVLCKRGGTCNTNTHRKCSKCGLKKYNYPDYIECSELTSGDYICIPKPKKFNDISTFDGAEELAELLGFYLAEGSVLYSHRYKDGRESKIGGVSLCFNINEKDYINRVENLALRLGATSVSKLERPHKSTCDVNIYGKQLGEALISLGGRGCATKKLDLRVINSWSSEGIKKLLVAWMKGDGSFFGKKGKGFAYSGVTISEDLAKDLTLLFYRLGICVGYYTRKEENKKRSYTLTVSGTDMSLLGLPNSASVKYSSKKQYKVSEDYLFVPIKDIKHIQISLPVFNLEVDEDESYIANNVGVHNCAKGYVVKGFRLLRRKAFGVDISTYAIDNVPKDIQNFCWLIEENGEIPTRLTSQRRWDWVIAKDVLEHMPTLTFLDRVLGNIHKVARSLFVVVPLAEHGKFVAPANEHDSTHYIRMNLEEWQQRIEHAGFKAEKTEYRVPGIKDSYSQWERAHGFFVLSTEG